MVQVIYAFCWMKLIETRQRPLSWIQNKAVSRMWRALVHINTNNHKGKKESCVSAPKTQVNAKTCFCYRVLQVFSLTSSKADSANNVAQLPVCLLAALPYSWHTQLCDWRDRNMTGRPCLHSAFKIWMDVCCGVLKINSVVAKKQPKKPWGTVLTHWPLLMRTLCLLPIY